jgi:hypothetical protein
MGVLKTTSQRSRCLKEEKGAASHNPHVNQFPYAQPALNEVCHYMVQPLVELYGGCMVVLKVS